MTVAHSKLTAQGQISVPAEVRKRLGVGPGSVLEWEEQDGQIVVRRAGRQDWNDVRSIAFPGGPPKKRSLDELKKGIHTYVLRKHARD
jgi:AbrB family looped-hinge helix DNA binding protein